MFDTEFEFDFFDLNNTTPEAIPAEYASITSEQLIEKKAFNKERGEWERN